MSSPASPSHVLKPSLHCLADALTTVKIFVKDTLEPQSGLTSIPCSQLARTPLSLPPSHYLRPSLRRIHLLTGLTNLFT